MADEAFQRQLLRALGKLGVARAKPHIVSSRGNRIRALQRALKPILLSDTKLVLDIPHYWAVYVHDGRGAPLVPKNSTFFIWWKDPRKDPRLAGGRTPERMSQLRHLSKGQFKKAWQARDEALAAGRESPVVITKKIRKRTKGTSFFSNAPSGGMSGFTNEANKAGMTLFRGYVGKLLKKELGITTFIPSGGSFSVRQIKEEIKATL